MRLDHGFAEVDPLDHLARRVAQTSEPETVIAALLGQAYAAVFDEQLRGTERDEATRGLTVAATRHGRTSTTLVLAAPVAARPHLVRHMRSAALRAFGEHVDVDGLVDQNGDVLVRVTWDARRPVSSSLLETVDETLLPCAWEPPCLVPALVLHDRQHLSINWHGISNLLVAAPTGQGADVPLVAFVAALASLRPPEELELLVIARPHMLPAEVGMFPHGRREAVDPGDGQELMRVLERLKAEVDRRRQSGSAAHSELVVVVRELGDLIPDAQSLLGAAVATGPERQVRVLAATELPTRDLLQQCSLLEEFGTRLVLHAAAEEDSVALLGMPGAERLGAGGQALLRLEARLPVPGWARYVPADRLARLVHMMGARAPSAPPQSVDELGTPPDTTRDFAHQSEAMPRSAGESPAEASGGAVLEAGVSSSCTPERSLVARLRAAPIRIRCFGAGEVWYRDRLLDLRDPELLLLFGVHPLSGIKNESLGDMLWGDPPADLAAALRKARFNLRKELRRLVPELEGDPLPGTEHQGEKVIALDTLLASSDVHEFNALLDGAELLEPAAAIDAYESALGLYQGELLDSPSVLTYRWMYDEDPQVALTLRSDYRRRQRDVRLRLAELLASGPEAGLHRADELYSSLCAEDPEDERLWTALFQIYARTGNELGLNSAVRRLRGALAELGTGEIQDVETLPLPANLERLVQQTRRSLGVGSSAPVV